MSHAQDYGENCFEFYDQLYGAVDRGMIDCLQQLANGGSVLELGIGTGRVALPLAARGVAVQGIDASGSMLERMAQKPGGARIPVRLGNFAEGMPGGPFSLIFALVSTFYLLSSAREQQQCLQAAAHSLSGDGVVLLENYEPAAALSLFSLADSDASHYLTKQVIQTDRGPRTYAAQICHVSLERQDQMAANAGLQLRSRWRDWRQQSYVAREPRHISIYESGSKDLLPKKNSIL